MYGFCQTDKTWSNEITKISDTWQIKTKTWHLPKRNPTNLSVTLEDNDKTQITSVLDNMTLIPLLNKSKITIFPRKGNCATSKCLPYITSTLRRKHLIADIHFSYRRFAGCWMGNTVWYHVRSNIWLCYWTIALHNMYNFYVLNMCSSIAPTTPGAGRTRPRRPETWPPSS